MIPLLVFVLGLTVLAIVSAALKADRRIVLIVLSPLALVVLMLLAKAGIVGEIIAAIWGSP